MLPTRLWSACTYRLSPPFVGHRVARMIGLDGRASRLALQPQRGGATAVVEREVGGIVLHIWLPRARDHRGDQVHTVLLLRHQPLDVVNDALASLEVLCPALFLHHRRELGV